MNASREMLEERSERYARKLRETNSYLKELKDSTAEYGTDVAHFEEDLSEAGHNVKYYEDEIARIKAELGGGRGGPAGAGSAPDDRTAAGAPAVADAILPRTVRQGVGSLILTSITFVAGAILGSRLKSRGAARPG